MKKILLSLFVFSFLTVGVFQAEASVLGDLINEINSLRGNLSANVIDSVTRSTILGTETSDLTPRIMYWWGKVNQHVDPKTSMWETDPDGSSGASLDKLTYCKKWYPNTVEVKDYQYETIGTWRAAGNIGEYPSTKMSTECVQPSVTSVCEDSDGGKDYYVKGSISGLPSSSLGVRTLGVDTCINPNTNVIGSTGTHVLETYCSSTSSMSEEQILCAYGCSNGACLKTIPLTPSITVLSPNGGETYKIGDNVSIKLNIVNPNKLPVAISLIYPGGVKDLLGINGDLVGDSYTWKIPENIAPGNYLIKGSIYSCDANLSCNSIIQDSSNSSFTITTTTSQCVNGATNPPVCTISNSGVCINGATNPPLCTLIPTNTPSITVLSPNGGNTYTAGEQIKIEWKALNVPDDSVATIALVDKTGNNYYLNSNMMCTSTSPCINIHNGYYTTTIPKTLSSGQYKARVICNVSGSDRACVDSNWEDLSDNYFTILPTTSPTITVLSPSAGDSFTAGQTITVKWETQNVPSTFKLGIIRLRNYSNTTNTGNEYDLTTNNTTLNDGQEILVIPSNIPSGHYKLEIKSYLSADAPFFDDSEYFTISSKANPLITALYPRGGEIYQAGQQIQVKWSSLGLSSSDLVNIYLYIPSQGLDLSLATNTVNDGIQTITLPNVLTKYGNIFKIKVSQFSTNTSMGVSEDYFTISSSINNIGCPAGAVYSMTTGQLCPNSGCSKGEIYSSTTGLVCLKNGCPAGAVYSMTTGQLCSNNTVVCAPGYLYDPYTGKLCSSIPSSPTSSLLPQCSDNIDNDIDGALDRGDNQCHFGANYYKAYINNFDSESSDELSKIRVLRLTFPLMTGEDIKALQENIGVVPADGVFGYNTYNAVKNWQMKNGLMADGIFGPASYNQMYLELFKAKNSLY